MPDVALTAQQRLYCEMNNITFNRDAGTIDQNIYNQRIATLTQEDLTAALTQAQSAKQTICIDGKNYNLDRNDPDLMFLLGTYGFNAKEVATLFDKNPDQIQIAIQSKAQTYAAQNHRRDQVLLMNADRYAKLDNFEQMQKLDANPTQNTLTTRFPKAQYPDLYKKDGTINERKAWNQLEDETMFEILSGKTKQARINELMSSGTSEDDAIKTVTAQNESFLKQEQIVLQKQTNGATLTEEEAKFVRARETAHIVKKDMKQFGKNVQECIDRINNAIDKMNTWTWSKLNNEQQAKIRTKYYEYMNAQNNNLLEGEKPIEDIFDTKGNLIPEKKNHLYQFVMDHVTGTDGQVNKSAKKGNFFQKMFQKRNVEFTEKRASRDLGLNKKDILEMGFDWENQISLGKVILDGIEGAGFGALMGFAMNNSVTAQAHAHDEQTASVGLQDQKIEIPYEGSVDYLRNGQLVMEIPYNGIATGMLSDYVGALSSSKTAVADANDVQSASKNGVLPAALITGVTSMLNSAYQQGVNGNEKDVFSNNLWDSLSTNVPKSPEDLVKMSGTNLDSPEGRIAINIAAFYFDPETKEFDKNTFLTDWQYNGGYKSKFLNTQEAAMWLNNLKENGPKKPPKVNVTVNIPPQIQQAIAYDINHTSLTPEDVNGTLYITDYDQKYADGWSIDTKTNARNGNPVGTTYNPQRQLATKGNVSAQAIYASNGDGHAITVKPRIVDGKNDFNRPQTITLEDNTNTSHVHTFVYELLTPQEMQEFGLENETKPMYKLVSATDENGTNIRNQKSPNEVYRLDLDPREPNNVLTYDNETNQYINTTVYNYMYNLKQDNPNYPGYGLSSIDYMKYSNYKK